LIDGVNESGGVSPNAAISARLGLYVAHAFGQLIFTVAAAAFVRADEGELDSLDLGCFDQMPPAGYWLLPHFQVCSEPSQNNRAYDGGHAETPPADLGETTISRRYRMTRRTVPVLAALLFAASALAIRCAAAEPLLLKYAAPSPPNSSIYKDLIKPWAEKVTGDSGGTLNVKVYVGYTLVNMVNTLDRVQNGVADIAFCILGPVSRQFPKTLVATLPYVAANAHEAGLALQRLYDQGVITDEWQGVKPIAFGDFANLTYHTVPMVKNLDDLKGLKMSVQGRIAGDTLEALGGTPISLPINDVYEALRRGTIQGAAIGWPADVDFKLTDVAKHHLLESLGGAEAVMIMNKNTYAKLSGKAKAAIDANIGAFYTNWFNKVIDDTEHVHIDQVEHMKDQTVTKLSPAQQALWKKRADKVIGEWVKRTPDGAHVLEAFKKQIAAIRSGS
jgi:TRAP-type transport system periplasmic protein